MDATQPLGNTSSLGWPSCCHMPYWKAEGQTFLSTTAVFSFLSINCSHGYGCMECHLECSGILNAFVKGASDEQSFINLEAFVHLVFGGHPPCCVRRSPDHNVMEIRKFILESILKVSTLLEAEAQTEHSSCDNTFSSMFCSGICIKLENEVTIPIVNSWSFDIVQSTENIQETPDDSLNQARNDTLTATNSALQDVHVEVRSPSDEIVSHNLTGTLETSSISNGNAPTETVPANSSLPVRNHNMSCDKVADLQVAQNSPANAVVVSSDTLSSGVTSGSSVLDSNSNVTEVPEDSGSTLSIANRNPSIELEVNHSEGCSPNYGHTRVRSTSQQQNVEVGIVASSFVASSTRSKKRVYSNSKGKTSDLFPVEKGNYCFALGSDGNEPSCSFTNGVRGRELHPKKISSIQSSGNRVSQKQQRLFDLRAKARKQPVLSHTRDTNREKKAVKKKYKKDRGEKASRSSTPVHRKQNSRDNDTKQTTARSKCTLCSKTFVSPKLLSDHLRSHITVGEPDTCPVCEKKFANKYTLHAHIDCHTGYRPYKCRHCHKTFTLQSSLHNHKVRNCVQYKKECGKKAVRKSTPLHRKQSSHDKDVMHKQAVANTCTLCSGTFDSSELLSNHLHSHVKTSEPRTCPLCGKNFANKSCLRAHINLHIGYRPFECSFCHMKFHGYGSLYSHKAGKNGQKCHGKVAKSNGTTVNICTLCNVSVSSPELLSNHLRSHIKVEDPTVCPLCEKKLARKYHLLAHIDGHTGHRPYSCRHCHMSFARNSSRYNHEARHNKTCNQCDKKFKSIKRFTSHLRAHRRSKQ